MITIQLVNGFPYAISSGLATKVKGQSIPEADIPADNDINYCQLECEYVEWVFAKTGSTNFWENDKNSFLFRRLVPADTVEIKLFKDGVDIATITDDTYGEFFNGFLSGSDEQQLYVGFIIDWQKVLDLEGTGSYEVITTTDILGTITTINSHIFELYIYSDTIADGTVRIETTQNGNITGSTFDYTSLEWYQSVRIRAKLFEEAPNLEKIEYITQNYEKNQVQDKIIPQWKLETNLLPRMISKQIIQDNTLANIFLVTDYNIINESVYRRIPLYTEEITKDRFSGNRRSAYQITFTDKVENLIKRNF